MIIQILNEPFIEVVVASRAKNIWNRHMEQNVQLEMIRGDCSVPNTYTGLATYAAIVQ
ncbi:unnamed protein product, partial [Allacma fusca]